MRGTPEVKSTNHLYIDLPAIKPELEKWIDKRSVEGFWAKNALQMTKSWIRDGLKERCITRDLKWGIPVPKEGYTDKVFYVWFDAPIGYISIAANHTDDWEKWWKNPDEVDLFQFIGKDNIPFHTVIFPSTLIGSGENWTKLYHMSSSEYLNYEGGKFSKSKGVGVFGTDCRETGIPADVWRFYIFYNRPEKSDSLFTWKDFQEKVNSELIGNLGNLINRTTTFISRFFDGEVVECDKNSEFWQNVRRLEDKITSHFERAELKDAYHTIFELSAYGNKVFQEAEPWKTKADDPEGTKKLLSDLIYLVRDLAYLITPYTPATSEKIASFIITEDMSWEKLGNPSGDVNIGKSEILFSKLEDDFIEKMRARFTGTQKEREMEENKDKAPEDLPVEDRFDAKIDLRVAKITAIERHPEAEKLYIETIDTGEEEESQIVSGLVPHYSEEELLGKNIILVKNLKPAKLRGVKSYGMLLAAEGEDGTVEVIFADNAEPGTPVVLEGSPADKDAKKKKLSVDRFFEIPLHVKSNTVSCGEKALTADGVKLTTVKVSDGEVG